jgi:hypothetical protein
MKILRSGAKLGGKTTTGMLLRRLDSSLVSPPAEDVVGEERDGIREERGEFPGVVRGESGGKVSLLVHMIKGPLTRGRYHPTCSPTLLACLMGLYDIHTPPFQ